jgi:hypothetical protein
MLIDQHRQILREAHRVFGITKDIQVINDAIVLVKCLAPEKFFREEKELDPSLAKRVFVHQPYSAHWSGTALTNRKAW